MSCGWALPSNTLQEGKAEASPRVEEAPAGRKGQGVASVPENNGRHHPRGGWKQRRQLGRPWAVHAGTAPSRNWEAGCSGVVLQSQPRGTRAPRQEKSWTYHPLPQHNLCLTYSKELFFSRFACADPYSALALPLPCRANPAIPIFLLHFLLISQLWCLHFGKQLQNEQLGRKNKRAMKGVLLRKDGIGWQN